MTKPLIIIPCAGLGTRMDMPIDKSKEMLPDPVDNEPIINWILEKVQNPLVITRKEKVDLINYVPNSLVIDVTGEMPSSVLASKNLWLEKNILAFPDTRWSLGEGTLPEDIFSQIEKELETNDLVFAVHKVDDCRLWGKVLLDPFTKKPLATVEKQNIAFKLEGLAWGLIGFKKHIGEELFQAYSDRKYFTFPKPSEYGQVGGWKVKVIELESFKDITRTGTVENFLNG